MSEVRTWPNVAGTRSLLAKNALQTVWIVPNLMLNYVSKLNDWINKILTFQVYLKLHIGLIDVGFCSPSAYNHWKFISIIQG